MQSQGVFSRPAASTPNRCEQLVTTASLVRPRNASSTSSRRSTQTAPASGRQGAGRCFGEPAARAASRTNCS